MENSETLGRHAVDGPLRVAVVVADGDGEAAVVGPDEVDLLARPARDGQCLALARVGRVVPRLLWKNNGHVNINSLLLPFFYSTLLVYGVVAGTRNEGNDGGIKKKERKKQQIKRAEPAARAAGTRTHGLVINEHNNNAEIGQTMWLASTRPR